MKYLDILSKSRRKVTKSKKQRQRETDQRYREKQKELQKNREAVWRKAYSFFKYSRTLKIVLGELRFATSKRNA